MLISNGMGEVLKIVNTGEAIFEEDARATPVVVKKNYRGFVPWGVDNLRPQKILKLVRKDEVMNQNQLFNTLCCYAGGVKVLDEKTGLPIKCDSSAVWNFFRRNRLAPFFLEQVSDIQYFFFSVAVIILNKKGDRIVQLLHKEAGFCRFETANPDTGRVEHVFYANWAEHPRDESVEAIPLLNIVDPLGDLEQRMGITTNDEGEYKTTTDRKFAILTRVPTGGNKYYPSVPFWAVFRSGWYDIKQMIPTGKKANFKNGLAVRWMVEINGEYRKKIFEEEKISDPVKQSERWKKEKANIRDFMMGVENEGKVWVTGFYVDPTGKEQSMVRISQVGGDRKGGEWISDSEEASNMICYAQGIHPSLIGATPGKTKGSFSGSDKRELFTMKQSLNLPIHDQLRELFFVIQEFNRHTDARWGEVVFDIPLIMLSTLDKGSDAVKTNYIPIPSDDDTE